jgi:phosphoglycolate phosphatase
MRSSRASAERQGAPVTDAVRLVLWDIDGTLLETAGAGREAMGLAGLDLVGHPFEMDGVLTSGRLDPQIWTDVAEVHGVADAPAREPEFRRAYAARLELRLAQGRPARALPGVAALVAALRGRAGFAQGLLTGNYPETGALKLASAGIDLAQFPVQAWGCDAVRRPDLVPVALARAASLIGVGVRASDAIVIGDTLHDVACAVEHGCRALAVGTSGVSLNALRDAGADWVVPDLSHVAEILDWLAA